jgi:hypothetical protein
LAMVGSNFEDGVVCGLGLWGGSNFESGNHVVWFLVVCGSVVRWYVLRYVVCGSWSCVFGLVIWKSGFSKMRPTQHILSLNYTYTYSRMLYLVRGMWSGGHWFWVCYMWFGDLRA